MQYYTVIKIAIMMPWTQHEKLVWRSFELQKPDYKNYTYILIKQGKSLALMSNNQKEMHEK